jgi:putative pyruvate formate lyase activating enzyme
VLPGFLEQSREVLEWFAEHGKGRALLSLMFQYAPLSSEGWGHRQKLRQGPQRTVSRREHERVLSWLEGLGIEDGFVQDPATGDEWLPDFRRRNPFPQGQAAPIWHYGSGYVD